MTLAVVVVMHLILIFSALFIIGALVLPHPFNLCATLLQFNEQNFTVTIKDSCTPRQLAEFLEKDAVRVEKAQKVVTHLCHSPSLAMHG